MRIIGFIGPSGTGKSHRSTWVAKDNNAQCIIDDGLLIKGNRVLAGKSAKAEPTKIGSVKCALFTTDEHRDEVVEALEKEQPDGLLILGTSDAMVEKIVERLGYKTIDKRVYITDIATENEIKTAMQTRRMQGKHIIPVPTFEVKQNFSGYFLHPIRTFMKKGKDPEPDKTVVRPTFSYMGSFTISDNVFNQITEHIIEEEESTARTAKFDAEKHWDGMKLSFAVNRKTEDEGWSEERQAEVKERIKNEIEDITSINITGVEMEVRNKGK